MRKPDETEDRDSHGLVVTLDRWIDPTDLEWDGDEPLPENSEGWDLMVRATLTFGYQVFTGLAACGGFWATPDSDGRNYLEMSMKELEEEALQALWEEIEAIKDGREVIAANARRRTAKTVLKNRVST
jgi:hypothetical protein